MSTGETEGFKLHEMFDFNAAADDDYSSPSPSAQQSESNESDFSALFSPNSDIESSNGLVSNMFGRGLSPHRYNGLKSHSPSVPLSPSSSTPSTPLSPMSDRSLQAEDLREGSLINNKPEGSLILRRSLLSSSSLPDFRPGSSSQPMRRRNTLATSNSRSSGLLQRKEASLPMSAPTAESASTPLNCMTDSRSDDEMTMRYHKRGSTSSLKRQECPVDEDSEEVARQSLRRTVKPSLSCDESSDDSPFSDEYSAPPRRKGTKSAKKRHMCKIEGCEASFTRGADLTRHISTIHKGKLTRCKHCGREFSRADACKRHEDRWSCGKRTKKDH